MIRVNPEINQESLDALRGIRRKLYAIPESDLNAMGLEDQVKYGGSLHQTCLAILTLEHAKLIGVNDPFKENEEELKNSALKLERDLDSLTDMVEFIRAASEGLLYVTGIISRLNRKQE